MTVAGGRKLGAVDSDGNEFALRVSGVSKVYAIYERPEDRLKQMIVPRAQSLFGRQVKTYHRDF